MPSIVEIGSDNAAHIGASPPPPARPLTAPRPWRHAGITSGTKPCTPAMPTRASWFQGWNLEEADVDAQIMPAGLDDLHSKRLAHRHLPGFGLLADRTLVYWPFNPPIVDLFDPELKDVEISRERFEAAWHRARRDNRDL
ncbi:hypothetical protein [Spongiactinospora sp. TRM90649]|uniref:hypothetical protein n=1 Tax=Spongiactinospora sp. TRM90649 TaxID=3031114 RepID=UPI0023F7FD32|nr:hypothetical protein [Spongiactinospora sp. TRM90649]MDF5757360.1 hypothetical protein [Spongiactinospora sp. TRM90649]